MSTQLEELGIEQGRDVTRASAAKPDLVIIGNALSGVISRRNGSA